MVAFIVEKNDTFFYGMEEKHVGKQRRVGKERITQQAPFGLSSICLTGVVADKKALAKAEEGRRA
jgi:hypothetical protein